MRRLTFWRLVGIMAMIPVCIGIGIFVVERDLTFAVSVVGALWFIMLVCGGAALDAYHGNDNPTGRWFHTYWVIDEWNKDQRP